MQNLIPIVDIYITIRVFHQIDSGICKFDSWWAIAKYGFALIYSFSILYENRITVQQRTSCICRVVMNSEGALFFNLHEILKKSVHAVESRIHICNIVSRLRLKCDRFIKSALTVSNGRNEASICMSRMTLMLSHYDNWVLKILQIITKEKNVKYCCNILSNNK